MKVGLQTSRSSCFARGTTTVIRGGAGGFSQPARTGSRLIVRAEQDEEKPKIARPGSERGENYTNAKRRKGRPAWQRSPDDSPFRDGNRDRLIGLLTARSADTLRYYFSETNMHNYHWLTRYMKEHPIPASGTWDEVSGEEFLRTLLKSPVEDSTYDNNRPAEFNHGDRMAVDPRSIAQRIMDIRAALAKEMIQDLSNVGEENAILLRESFEASFSIDMDEDDLYL